MKSRLAFIALVVCVIWSGCSAPKFLPSSKAVGLNPYGAYICIDRFASSAVEGELLAVQPEGIFVFREDGTQQLSVFVPMEEVENYSLRYAKPVNYWWSLPVFLLSTLSHGWIAVITAPVNLIVTTWVSISSERSFSYSDDDIPLQELHMFARFPQGVPSGFHLEQGE